MGLNPSDSKIFLFVDDVYYLSHSCMRQMFSKLASMSSIEYNCNFFLSYKATTFGHFSFSLGENKTNGYCQRSLFVSSDVSSSDLLNVF